MDAKHQLGKRLLRLALILQNGGLGEEKLVCSERGNKADKSPSRLSERLAAFLSGVPGSPKTSTYSALVLSCPYTFFINTSFLI